VTSARLGGVAQTVATASTALNADHSPTWMVSQALCAFQRRAGVGGACAASDPLFDEYSVGLELSCVGGESTKCGGAGGGTRDDGAGAAWEAWEAWQLSVRQAPALIDWQVSPLSPYIEAAGHTKLAAAFDDAEAAYAAEQVAARPLPTPPPTCNDHGAANASANATECTCDTCYSGRDCSVRDYAHPSTTMTLWGDVHMNWNPNSGGCKAWSLGPKSFTSFRYNACGSGDPIFHWVAKPSFPDACDGVSCAVLPTGRVQACVMTFAEPCNAAGNGTGSGTGPHGALNTTFHASMFCNGTKFIDRYNRGACFAEGVLGAELNLAWQHDIGTSNVSCYIK